MSQPPSGTLNVGLVGATGMVGEVFLDLLAERNFPVKSLKLFASDRSKGQTREFKNQKIPLEVLEDGCFKGLDLVFFSSGDDISKEWAPKCVVDGAYAIDNSAAFRMDPQISLVVPEVNGHLLRKTGSAEHRSAEIIANPNCSTIQLVVPLRPLMADFGLESVHVASYQAVSGAGKIGQEELMSQTKAWAAGASPPAPQTFPHTIAMNCVPQIGSFNDQGFCSEEVKIMKETKKILGRDDFRISAFTVRIPAWNAHSEAVWVRLKKNVTRDEIISSLKKQAGLVVEDGPNYPTAVDYDGKDPVAVGRIHQDPEDPQTWMMWVVADNLRKGAALNGIQIAERIFDIN